MKIPIKVILIGITPFLAIAILMTTAVKLEYTDSFCAACHTEPESEYYLRSINPPTDLASAHTYLDVQVRCIDCHSGEGAIGRVNSLKQGAADLLAYFSGSYNQPAITQIPVGDIGCTKCHLPPIKIETDPKAGTISSASHYHFASYLAEWKNRTAGQVSTCAFCHIPHDIDSTVNEGFVITSQSNIACAECHLVLSGWIPPN